MGWSNIIRLLTSGNGSFRAKADATNNGPFDGMDTSRNRRRLKIAARDYRSARQPRPVVAGRSQVFEKAKGVWNPRVRLFAWCAWTFTP